VFVRRVLILLVSGLSCLGLLTVPASGSVIAAVGDLGCSPNDPNYNGGNGVATPGMLTVDWCRSKYVAGLLKTANGGNPVNDFLPLGDDQYYAAGDASDLTNFTTVYGGTFGLAGVSTHPALGNAEYGLDGTAGTPPPDTGGASAFFSYFPSVPTSGYYSYNIGNWHLVALNSNCEEYSLGCAAAQESWLASDLAAHPDQCTLAYFHHARWNSGALGNDSRLANIWSELYNAGADIVLNGHSNHHYERFAPQNPSEAADPVRGITEFIVSTGGQNHGTAGASQPNSVVRNYNTFGVLALTLNAAGYSWQFVHEPASESAPGVSPAPGDASFSDAGSGSCHSVHNTTPPTVTGVAQATQKLVANPGTWTGATPIAVSYQWQQCNPSGGSCTPIALATAASYVAGAGDVGHTLRVVATASNSVPGSAVVTSGASATVQPGPPTNTTPPSVIGIAQESRTVTCTNGGWQTYGAAISSYSYTWQRDGRVVQSGGSAYTLSGVDVAATVTCSVVATNSAGLSAPAKSTGVAVTPLPPASVSPPQINGIAQVGHTLSCAPGSWAHFPASFVFGWLLNGNPVGGSSTSYRVARGDVGQSITCHVQAANISGSASALSPAVIPVTGSDITITTSPSPPSGIVRVAWPRAIIVSGIVTEDSGQPAPHARIQFELETLAGTPLGLVTTITTDRNGRYRAAILPGRNGLLVAHVLGSPLVSPVDGPPVQVSVTPGIAKLHAARNKHARIVISGRVLVTSPASGVVVRITLNGKTIAKARPDRRGRFSITLPASVAAHHRFVLHIDPRHPGMLNAVIKPLRV
jgi:acid phosphatase type 7